MSYLCKLATPTNGIVLDPFMGSGTTGVAAVESGYSFVGIEKESDYFSVAKSRFSWTPLRPNGRFVPLCPMQKWECATTAPGHNIGLHYIL